MDCQHSQRTRFGKRRCDGCTCYPHVPMKYEQPVARNVHQYGCQSRHVQSFCTGDADQERAQGKEWGARQGTERRTAVPIFVRPNNQSRHDRLPQKQSAYLESSGKTVWRTDTKRQQVPTGKTILERMSFLFRNNTVRRCAVR